MARRLDTRIVWCARERAVSRWPAPVVAVGGAVMLAFALSGCSAPVSGEAAGSSDEQLVERAREVNFAFKAEVAAAQMQISGEEWEIADYGSIPHRTGRCNDGEYAFSVTHNFPPVVGPASPWTGWHVDDEDRERTVQRVAAWFEENGWIDIESRTFGGEITDVAISARKPDAYVSSLTVDISPGDPHDMVQIYADSVCERGDGGVLFDLLTPYPDDVEAEAVPETERPDAPPSFGYSQDGRRLFWPDEEK